MKKPKVYDYEKDLKRFLIPILRRRSIYWKARNEAKKLARVERGLYKCKNCEKLYTGSQVEVDHVRPVINVKVAWISWDHFIRSLFCDVSNFQILCRNCHLLKTSLENILRQAKKIKVKKKLTTGSK